MTSQPIVRPQLRPLIDLREAAEPQPRLRLVASPAADFEQQRLDLEFPAPRHLRPLQLVGSPVLRQRSANGLEASRNDNDDALFDRQATATADLPAAAAWARTFSQAVAEVLVGKRPARQMSRWVTPQLGSELAAEARRHVSARGQAHRRTTLADRISVRSVRVDEPADGVAEVAAVVQGRNRSRALMMRFEGWDGRWICTVAQLI